MYCSECGNQMPDGANFCGACGAPTKAGMTGAGGGTPGGIPTGLANTPPPPPPSGLGGGATGSGGGSSAVMWVAIAAIAAVIIALAIAVPLIMIYGGETDATTTTTGVEPSTTTTAATTTSEPPTSTTSESTTSTTAATTPTTPGDSAGAWVEQQIPGVPEGVYDVAISDEAFAWVTFVGDQPKLSVYLFAEDRTLAIPVDSMMVGGPDLEGRLLVWREADYDADNLITAAHVFAYRLPDGPKVEIVSNTKLAYPQVAGSTVAWPEMEPWPDEEGFVLIRIMATAVDQDGRPSGAVGELVPAALASVMGDSSWSFSLGPRYLSWETHIPVDVYDPGTYLLHLDSMKQDIVSPEAWDGSIGGDFLVFREGSGINMVDLRSGRPSSLDTSGVYPSAAPTYAAYFRPTSGGDWQVVARGFTGSYEQTLSSSTGDPPWFLPSIATSPNRIAFVVGEKVRTFVWRAD